MKESKGGWVTLQFSFIWLQVNVFIPNVCLFYIFFFKILLVKSCTSICFWWPRLWMQSKKHNVGNNNVTFSFLHHRLVRPSLFGSIFLTGSFNAKPTYFSILDRLFGNWLTIQKRERDASWAEIMEEKKEFPGRRLVDLVFSWSIKDVLNEYHLKSQVCQPLNLNFHHPHCMQHLEIMIWIIYFLAINSWILFLANNANTCNKCSSMGCY